MMISKELRHKIIENQVIDALKKNKFDPIEKSVLIGHYVSEMEKKGLTRNQIAIKLGIERKSLYRELQFLEIPKEVIKEAREKQISMEKLKRISYNLKDKSKLGGMLKHAGSNNTLEVEKYIAEMNDKNKVYPHFEQLLYKFTKSLEWYKGSVNKIPQETKKIAIEKIDNVISELEQLKQMLLNGR